jgi:hypothetical protein
MQGPLETDDAMSPWSSKDPRSLPQCQGSEGVLVSGMRAAHHGNIAGRRVLVGRVSSDRPLG